MQPVESTGIDGRDSVVLQVNQSQIRALAESFLRDQLKLIVAQVKFLEVAASRYWFADSLELNTSQGQEPQASERRCYRFRYVFDHWSDSKYSNNVIKRFEMLRVAWIVYWFDAVIKTVTNDSDVFECAMCIGVVVIINARNPLRTSW